MFDLVTLILVGAVALLLGAVLGAWIASLFAGREPGRPQDDDGDEVVRVRRDRQSGHLSLDVDGRVFQDVGDITVNQYRRMRALLVSLGQWLDVPELAESSAVEPAPEPEKARTVVDLKGDEVVPPFAEKSADEPAEKIVEGVQTAPEIDTPTLAPKASKVPVVHPPREEEPEPREVKPVGTKIFKSFLRAIRLKMPGETAMPPSIAAQVDAILQKKLEDSPLRERAIRLMELPDRGLVVMVGMDQYEGVEEVPEEDIRSLLRECVAEWEERHAS